MVKIEPIEPALAASLGDVLGVPPLVAGVLAARGIRTCEDGQRFLHPKLDHLPTPSYCPT